MFLCGFDDLKMPPRTPRGPSLLPAAAFSVSTAGTGHSRDQNPASGKALAKLQRSPVKVWEGLENPSSWRMRQQDRGELRACGDPAVPGWLQQLSWLPATVPTAPDTQAWSSVSQVLLPAWI